MESTHVNKIQKYGQVAVLLWDGFGLAKPGVGNAVEQARMNMWRALCKKYKFARLDADGIAVGLPPNMPGNSEAGHSTIGAGRAIESDLVTINKSIESKKLEDNPALLQAAANARRNRSTLHLMGLLTNHHSGHAYPDHLYALLEFVERLDLPSVALHVFTDGRDTPPYHAVRLIQMLKRRMPKNAVIASIIGRYYAMDRNRNWDRTALAYHCIANGEGVVSDDPVEAVMESYNRGASDEFILPTVICKNRTCVAPVRDHDSVIYWNLRSDRARQLVKPFVLPDFEHHERDSFKRHAFRKHIKFITLTEFGSDLDSVIPAFPHREVPGTIVEALRYKRQVYVAESEKYSQVTYFLNGGYDRPRFEEERIRIPSQRVASYDMKPEMRASEIARRVVDSLEDGADMVFANFANADMVGHTGNLYAAIRACEVLDDSLAYVWNGVNRLGGTLIVTADHGNVEEMRNEHGGVDTEHNANPVPLLVAGKHVKGKRLQSHGTLADVAPTVLKLLNVEKPKEMKGRSLLN